MNWDFIMQMIGGLPGLLKAIIRRVQDAGMAKLDPAADRMATISEEDHRKLCKWARKDMPEAEIQEGLAKARLAGDKVGDYLAWLAKQKLETI